jgi:hypothetical protein
MSDMKVSVDNSGDWLIILIVLFWDFNGKYDLYDAIMNWLMK